MSSCTTLQRKSTRVIRTTTPLKYPSKSLQASNPKSPTEQQKSRRARAERYSSLLAMGKLADMFRDIYFALRQTSSLRARYNLVREYADRFARHHLDDWPELFPVGGAWLPGDPPPTTSTSGPLPATHTERIVEDGGGPPFVPWSRFNWSLLLNGMRLSMYKPFLNLAYTQGGEWTEVREVSSCLDMNSTVAHA